MSERTNLAAGDFAPPSDLARVQQLALAIGVIGLALSAIGYYLDPAQFYRSYLVGWVYWVAVGLGCLGWTMIYNLTAGTWGTVLRRANEAGARTLPFLFLLGLPFFFGMGHVFEWARPEAATDPIIQLKSAYLDVGRFWIRVVAYFGIWTFLAYYLGYRSRQQDETGDPKATIAMRTISGPGVVVLVLTSSFFAYDWLMSLNAHWFSSLYGFYFVSSTALTGMLFMIVVACWLVRREPMRAVIRAKEFHDYGKLTLALIMFWAYMVISQFLITWSGNIPEYTVWYQARNTGGWKPYTVLLVIFHFFVPFLMLLSAKLKKQPEKMFWVALYLLVMRWVDLYWQAAPTFYEHVRVHWLDLATVVGVGGLWVFLFVTQLRQRALVPVNDPYLPEVLPHG